MPLRRVSHTKCTHGRISDKQSAQLSDSEGLRWLEQAAGVCLAASIPLTADLERLAAYRAFVGDGDAPVQFPALGLLSKVKNYCII